MVIHLLSMTKQNHSHSYILTCRTTTLCIRVLCFKFMYVKVLIFLVRNDHVCCISTGTATHSCHLVKESTTPPNCCELWVWQMVELGKCDKFIKTD
jgi:hypothetical protein